MRAQYETNVFGLMAVTRAFLPEMRARRAGRIVDVSSLGGRLTLPFFGVYNSTKYAVESLSDALRIELGPFGVHVSLIEPGAIETEFTPRSLDGGDKYRRADSPYAPVLRRVRRASEDGRSRRRSGRRRCRARSLALRSRARPRARYVAPRFAGLFVALMRFVPTSWADHDGARAARLHAQELPQSTAGGGDAAAASSPRRRAAHADAVEGRQLGSRSSSPTASPSIATSSRARRSRSSAGAAPSTPPVSAILAVFSDVPHATEWMDSCNGSRSVEDISDSEKVVYNRTHAPWPVADRDAVLHNIARFDAAAERVELDFWSVEDKKEPPVKGVVRMPFLRGHWILSPSADGRTTRVEYQVHANPGGALPNWLVNYVSRDLPFKTIEGLRAQVKRRHYPEFEAHMKERFAQYPFLWPRS